LGKEEKTPMLSWVSMGEKRAGFSRRRGEMVDERSEIIRKSRDEAPMADLWAWKVGTIRSLRFFAVVVL
jgi:hypothetical protein